MVKSTALNWVIILSFLFGKNSALSQEKSNLQSEAVDTVVINKALPRYVLHFTRRLKPHSEDYEYRYFDKIEVRREHDTTLLQVIVDSTEGVTSFKVIDANFDGYTDLQLDHNPEMTLTTSNSFFLFDKDKGTFKFSDEFSYFTDVGVHREDSVIISSKYVGMQGSERETFKVIHGHPVLIKREIDRDDTTSTALLTDGKMTITEQTTYQGLQDTSCEGCTKVVYEKLIHNQLRITKEEILKPVEGEPTPKQRHNGLYREDFRGKFLLQEEQTSKYGRDKKGHMYRDVVRRAAIKDKLRVTKKSREYLN